jgi:hypothetical protein
MRTWALHLAARIERVGGRGVEASRPSAGSQPHPPRRCTSGHGCAEDVRLTYCVQIAILPW